MHGGGLKIRGGLYRPLIAVLLASVFIISLFPLPVFAAIPRVYNLSYSLQAEYTKKMENGEPKTYGNVSYDISFSNTSTFAAVNIITVVYESMGFVHVYDIAGREIFNGLRDGHTQDFLENGEITSQLWKILQNLDDTQRTLLLGTVRYVGANAHLKGSFGFKVPAYIRDVKYFLFIADGNIDDINPDNINFVGVQLHATESGDQASDEQNEECPAVELEGDVKVTLLSCLPPNAARLSGGDYLMLVKAKGGYILVRHRDASPTGYFLLPDGTNLEWGINTATLSFGGATATLAIKYTNLVSKDDTAGVYMLTDSQGNAFIWHGSVQDGLYAMETPAGNYLVWEGYMLAPSSEPVQWTPPDVYKPMWDPSTGKGQFVTAYAKWSWKYGFLGEFMFPMLWNPEDVELPVGKSLVFQFPTDEQGRTMFVIIKHIESNICSGRVVITTATQVLVDTNDHNMSRCPHNWASIWIGTRYDSYDSSLTWPYHPRWGSEVKYSKVKLIFAGEQPQEYTAQTDRYIIDNSQQKLRIGQYQDGHELLRFERSYDDKKTLGELSRGSGSQYYVKSYNTLGLMYYGDDVTYGAGSFSGYFGGSTTQITASSGIHGADVKEVAVSGGIKSSSGWESTFCTLLSWVDKILEFLSLPWDILSALFSPLVHYLTEGKDFLVSSYSALNSIPYPINLLLGVSLTIALLYALLEFGHYIISMVEKSVKILSSAPIIAILLVIVIALSGIASVFHVHVGGAGVCNVNIQTEERGGGGGDSGW